MNSSETHKPIANPSGTGDLIKVTLLLVAILVLVLMARQADAAPPGTLTFFAKSKVVGAVITVDDVARLQGVSDRELRDRIRGVELGRSPNPTVTRTLSRPMIVSALRQAGVFDRLRLRFPKRMRVTRPGRRLSASEVSALISSSLQRLAAKLSSDGAEVTLERSRWTRELLLPPGDVEAVASNGDRTPRSGLATFKVDFVVDGAVAATERVTARVSLTGSVCVLTVPVGRGELVGRQHVREKQGALTRGGIRCRDAIGRSARSNLRAGVALRASQLKAPTLVERGQPVAIMFRRGALQVRAQGQASRSGALGEWIPVVNVSSKKVLKARVESPGVVTVN